MIDLRQAGDLNLQELSRIVKPAQLTDSHLQMMRHGLAARADTALIEEIFKKRTDGA